MIVMNTNHETANDVAEKKLSMTTNLEAHFHATAIELGAKQATSEVFAELRTAYEDRARTYHSLEHVDECITLLTDVRATLDNPAEVAMAVWFHDAVYATHPFASSEEQSAALARKSCARMGIADPVARRIASMVRATKNHQLPVEDPDVHERDAATLFDVDLAILGADPVRYARYERDVRLEYGWVPEGLYRSKRAKILRAFSARPSIYRTSPLHDRLEKRARENIDRAVIELTAKVDTLVLHATDDHLFATRAARLERRHAWSELYFVSVFTVGSRASVSVAFSPDDDGSLQIELADPRAAEVLDRLHSIPDYDHDAEHRALTSGTPAIGYSRERHRPVVGPLQPRRATAYRGNA